MKDDRPMHIHIHAERKRCCVEPECGISHLRTIKRCRMKSQNKKARPKGEKERIPFGTSFEANRKKLPSGRPSGKNLLPALGMVGKR
ncbi:hypothetical protein CEXT_285321 [Caerostris extrusa]|uniref:Uncharacterized protein n=1 Tax=Caerostris extrusa TaxID=172846 RepID=A0AAV4P7Z8_CAEEX|nr:hypothetical protein CEXT_285321 [Caerostris extrusa]